MHTINNIDWFQILLEVATNMEKKFNISIAIDETIAREGSRIINEHLCSIGLIHPNAAKIAGQAAFWIRKLKPLHIAPSSKNLLLTLNECAALLVGLAICNRYKDDCSKCDYIALPPRILDDWIRSFRYHSHSPHSSMISFELLMCDG